MGDSVLPKIVRRHLDTKWLGHRMYYLPEVDSTNRVATVLAREGEAHGTVVVTDYQSAGRGSGGRAWASPARVNLLFSMILRPDRGSRTLFPITLSFGLAVAESLSAHVGQELGLKWPNDVWAKTGKLCGVLAESALQGDRARYVVAGVGVNVNMEPSAVAREVDQPVASCRSLTGRQHDRALILGDLLAGLEEAYERFLRQGFTGSVDRYNDRLILRGKWVSVGEGEAQRVGMVVGVNAEGGMILASDGPHPVVVFDRMVREV